MKNVNETNNQDKKINIVNTNVSAPKGESVKSGRHTGDKRRERVHEVDSRNKKHIPFGFAAFMIVLVVVLMMCVSNYVSLNEYTREISELKDQFDELKAEEKELSAELDKKYNLVEIEEYAKEQLGMVDSSEVDKKNIKVGDDEKIEVYEVEEEGTIGEITDALFALADNLIESWNTLIGNE